MEECLDILTNKNIKSWRFGEAQNHAFTIPLGIDDRLFNLTYGDLPQRDILSVADYSNMMTK